MSIVSFKQSGRVGLLTVDSPPVNALGHAVRRELAAALDHAQADTAISAVVLICAGRTFFAGADITEFGKPVEDPHLRVVLEQIENSPKPVVAAIHGSALGGGLELALVCHYRIGVPSARLGLPEVTLGLLPGAGGTQRLPRIVGVTASLDLLTSGRSLSGAEGLELGLLDRLAREEHLAEDAVAFAEDLVERGVPAVRIRDRELDPSQARAALFEEFRRRNGRAFQGREAPEAIIKAVEAAVSLPFEQGLAAEYALFETLEAGIQSRALRHLFFAERGTLKIPDVALAKGDHTIAAVGVIGAGTMGGGIAMNFLNAGIPVTLVDMTDEALQRGIAAIRRNYESGVQKGRLSQEAFDRRLALLEPTTDLTALAHVDLVIEAVFEQLEVKQDLFARLDMIARPGAILASNTSFLDLDRIAEATGRPDDVIGLHFFSPANVMRLLEVVRGRKTAEAVVATSMKLAKRINKTPVLSGVCHGFIANRIMFARGAQADAMMLEGVPVATIDRVMVKYGFAIGHFQMFDLAGLDVLGRGSTERSVCADLVSLGRLGQKSGAGYYDYDSARRFKASPVVDTVIADYAAFAGIKPGPALSDDAIIARLLLPVVNEGAKLLEEGIALRAADIDVAAVLGYNWPGHTGGPMFWADTIGLPAIVEQLQALQTLHGEAFAPSPLLIKMASGEGNPFFVPPS